MPSVEKIIQKMKNQPNGIRAEKVLIAYNLITITQGTPLKKAYVVDILNRIGE